MGERIYSVYEPANPETDIGHRAEKLVFIKDGFAWWAMIAPVIWLIYHRLWLGLIGFLAVLGALHGVMYLFGVTSEDSTALVSMGWSVGFGFLANDIRRLLIERRDYKLVGAIIAHSQTEGERRFFERWQPNRSAGEALV
jgi:hypothetical protein